MVTSGYCSLSCWWRVSVGDGISRLVTAFWNWCRTISKIENVADDNGLHRHQRLKVVANTVPISVTNNNVAKSKVCIILTGPKSRPQRTSFDRYECIERSIHVINQKCVISWVTEVALRFWFLVEVRFLVERLVLCPDTILNWMFYHFKLSSGGFLTRKN